MKKFDKLFEYVIVFALIICLITSIIDASVAGFIDLSENWYLPPVFAGLLAILYFSFKMIGVEDRLRNIDGKIQASTFAKFSNYPDYYSALQEALNKSNSEIMIMHARDYPPSQFTEAKDYFSAIEKWLSTHQQGVVRRISCPCNEAMTEFCREESERESKIDNYLFRWIPKHHDVSMVQVTIFDASEVFITIPGGAAQLTRGIFVDDPEVVKFCVDYYMNLWSNAKTWSDYHGE